jgi:hypothetical protein
LFHCGIRVNLNPQIFENIKQKQKKISSYQTQKKELLLKFFKREIEILNKQTKSKKAPPFFFKNSVALFQMDEATEISPGEKNTSTSTGNVRNPFATDTVIDDS